MMCLVSQSFAATSEQRLDHHKFVCQWLVGHKVQVAVQVCSFSVHSCRDGAIRIPLEKNIQDWELAY